MNRSLHLWPLLAGAALLLVLLLVTPPLGRRAPQRVLLVLPTPSAESGLDFQQGRALVALLEDELEVQGDCAVTVAQETPTDPALLRGGPSALVLELQPRRQGDDLALSARWMRGEAAPSSGPWPWTHLQATAKAPQEAMAELLKALPLRLRREGGAALLPAGSAAFWKLVEAEALRLGNGDLGRAKLLAEQVSSAEPGCTSAWILQGNLRYRQILNAQSGRNQDLEEAQALLTHALELSPAHPRASFLLALMQADCGAQRDALESLARARALHPRNPILLTGLAYAARISGLLDLSRRALDERSRWALEKLEPQGVDLTWLYLGQDAAFARCLQERPGHLRSSSGVQAFYRGYLALAEDKREEARTDFAQAAAIKGGYPPYVELSQVFAEALGDQRDAALADLRHLDEERTGLRVPDGEFTFKLGEAYALLGQSDAAMEVVSRAFAQGFGCRAWYERSPNLASLRALPKWRALTQHLAERQALLEERFPPGRFGL